MFSLIAIKRPARSPVAVELGSLPFLQLYGSPLLAPASVAASASLLHAALIADAGEP